MLIRWSCWIVNGCVLLTKQRLSSIAASCEVCFSSYLHMAFLSWDSRGTYPLFPSCTSNTVCSFFRSVHIRNGFVTGVTFRKSFKRPENGFRVLKRKRPLGLLQAEIICSSPLTTSNCGITQEVKLMDLSNNVSPVKSQSSGCSRYSIPSQISPLRSVLKKRFVLKRPFLPH